MVGGAGQKRLELPTIIGWAISLVSSALLVAVLLGQFQGGTDAKFEAQEATLNRHEGRLNGLEHRERERLIAAGHRRER